MKYTGLKNKIGDYIFNNVLKYIPHIIFFRYVYRKKSEMYRGIRQVVVGGGKYLNISIITPCCVGGELYALIGEQFLSPFINCTMRRHDYVNVVCNLREYMDSPYDVYFKNGFVSLRLKPELLPQVIINYPHDTDCDIVRNNWIKRKARIDYSRLVLILDDRGTIKEDLERFSKIKCFKKIYLTSSNTNYDFCHIIKHYQGKKSVGNYYEKDFIRGLWRFEYQWDYLSFLYE